MSKALTHRQLVVRASTDRSETAVGRALREAAQRADREAATVARKRAAKGSS